MVSKTRKPKSKSNPSPSEATLPNQEAATSAHEQETRIEALADRLIASLTPLQRGSSQVSDTADLDLNSGGIRTHVGGERSKKEIVQTAGNLARLYVRLAIEGKRRPASVDSLQEETLSEEQEVAVAQIQRSQLVEDITKLRALSKRTDSLVKRIQEVSLSTLLDIDRLLKPVAQQNFTSTVGGDDSTSGNVQKQQPFNAAKTQLERIAQLETELPHSCKERPAYLLDIDSQNINPSTTNSSSSTDSFFEFYKDPVLSQVDDDITYNPYEF